MPRGRELSDYEKGQILALDSACIPRVKIAEQLHRSRNLITRFLNDVKGYGRRRRTGRPKKLSDIAKRRLIREAEKGKMGSQQLVKTLQLTIKGSRVRQILSGVPHLRYKRIQRTPAMQPRHEKARVDWCMEKVTWNAEMWSTVVWSDEKKFNLDGPDGLAYKWHDLRKEKQWFSKRHTGGGSVMVWAAFAGTQKSALAILEGKKDRYKYIETLEDYLLPFTDNHLPLTWIFMQDGAPCHRALDVKTWFKENGIRILDWPAYSPDLNPIENLWGIIVRHVYANQRQFETVETLIDAITECWDSLSSDCLKKLSSSMQNRCIKVLQNKGKKIDY